jgi:hypothetical protein
MARILNAKSQRRNLNIDSDAFTIAATYANARGISIGAAVSELLRRAEQAPQPPSPLLRTDEYGLLVKAKAGRQVVTSEMAKKLSEEDDLE